jgi:hypothetical protein
VGSRVAVVRRLHVGSQQAAQTGQGADKTGSTFGGQLVQGFVSALLDPVVGQAKRSQDLPCQFFKQLLDINTDVIGKRTAVHR